MIENFINVWVLLCVLFLLWLPYKAWIHPRMPWSAIGECHFCKVKTKHKTIVNHQRVEEDFVCPDCDKKIEIARDKSSFWSELLRDEDIVSMTERDNVSFSRLAEDPTKFPILQYGKVQLLYFDQEKKIKSKMVFQYIEERIGIIESDKDGNIINKYISDRDVNKIKEFIALKLVSID